MKKESELFQELVDETRKEIAKADFYIDFYKKQVRNPKTMGVAQAKEAIDTWEQGKKNRKTHLDLLLAYQKENYGK